MKQVYEAWDDEENDYTPFGLAESLEDWRSKGLLSEGAKLRHRVEADTWEEAMALHYAEMGWGEYRPEGEPKDCPRGCGATFYPEGSGECPNCGKIC